MPKPKPSIGYHSDGTIWNKGQTLDGEMHGYWEFYRKDGVIMRSGAFDRGVQVGEWTTYDKAGKVYKVTKTKTPAKAATPNKPAPARKTSTKKAATKAPAKSAKAPKKAKASAEPTGDEVLAGIDHALKSDMELVRKAVLGADKSIAEGLKWNSLSFRTTDWFATWNWRAKERIQLVMHLGAKPGKQAEAHTIPDPKRLLQWLGPDRALITLGSGATLKSLLPGLKAVVKAWIACV